jgi:hypothetical protein
MDRGRRLSIFVKAGILASLRRPKESHTGQGHFPCVHHPRIKHVLVGHAGMCGTRHIYWSVPLLQRRMFHAISMPSNIVSKYTFMFFLGYFGPRIITDTNMLCRLMQKITVYCGGHTKWIEPIGWYRNCLHSSGCPLLLDVFLWMTSMLDPRLHPHDHMEIRSKASGRQYNTQNNIRLLVELYE